MRAMNPEGPTTKFRGRVFSRRRLILHTLRPCRHDCRHDDLRSWQGLVLSTRRSTAITMFCLRMLFPSSR